MIKHSSHTQLTAARLAELPKDICSLSLTVVLVHKPACLCETATFTLRVSPSLQNEQKALCDLTLVINVKVKVQGPSSSFECAFIQINTDITLLCVITM